MFWHVLLGLIVVDFAVGAGLLMSGQMYVQFHWQGIKPNKLLEGLAYLGLAFLLPLMILFHRPK